MSLTRSDSDASDRANASLRIDAGARLARIGACTLELEPRSFDLLALLCSEPGRVFGKQVLFERVWAGRVVSDAALVQSVARLRRAIEHAGGHPEWIRTAHAVGYAFDGPLASGPPAADLAIAEPAEPVRARRPWFVWLAVVVVLGLAWWWRQPAVEIDPPRVAVMPFDVDARASDADWAQLALPALVTEVLQQRTPIETIAAHRSRSALERLGMNADADERLRAERLRDVFGVDYVLFARLERRGDALHLDYRVLAPEGRMLQGSAEGEGAGALASSAAASVARTLDVAYAAGIPVRRISADEFVNEAFARGMQALLTGRSDDARGYFETALRGDSGAHWIRYELGNALQYLQRTDEAAVAYEDALAHAVRLGDRNLAGACRSGLGLLAWRGGRLDEAERQFELARTDFSAARNRANLASAIGNLGILADNRGDLERAVVLYREALRLYLEEGERAGESAVYSNLAVIDRRRGQLDQAAEHQRRAAALQQRIGLDQMRVFSENHLGTIERLRGRFAEAAAHLATAADIAQSNQDTLGIADATLGRAWLDFDLGHQAPAEAGARDAVALFERMQHPVSEAAARSLLAEVLLERDREQAQVQLQRVESIASTSDDQGVRVLAHVLAARIDADALPAAISLVQTVSDPVAAAEVAWLQARHSDAEVDWQRALDLARATGVPRSEARVAEDRIARAGGRMTDAERAELQARIARWRGSMADPERAERPES